MPGDLSITIMGIEALVSAKEAGIVDDINSQNLKRNIITNFLQDHKQSERVGYGKHIYKSNNNTNS